MTTTDTVDVGQVIRTAEQLAACPRMTLAQAEHLFRTPVAGTCTVEKCVNLNDPVAQAACKLC